MTGDRDFADDVINLINCRREERHRVAAILHAGLVKSYIEKRVRIECELSINGTASKWNLVLCAVKDGIEAIQVMRPSRRGGMVDGDTRAADLKGNEFGVIRGSQLVQSPKGDVSSFVWLEVAEDSHDFVGDVLADFSPANQI